MRRAAGAHWVTGRPVGAALPTAWRSMHGSHMWCAHAPRGLSSNSPAPTMNCSLQGRFRPVHRLQPAAGAVSGQAGAHHECRCQANCIAADAAKGLLWCSTLNYAPALHNTLACTPTTPACTTANALCLKPRACLSPDLRLLCAVALQLAAAGHKVHVVTPDLGEYSRSYKM